MNIVFIGYDYTLDIASRLIEDGHNIIHIYTFDCDNILSFNTQTKSFAEQLKIPISDNRINYQNIELLIDQGADIFICAGYPYKIPKIDNDKAYGINLHPSLLPRVRGIMPLPFVIMHDQAAAGFTIHKIDNDFDTGEILYQEAVIIDEITDVETLSARIAIRAPDAISTIVKNIKSSWENATPQDNELSSDYKAPSPEMRLLDWNDTSDNLRLKGLAYGRFGLIAKITNNMNETQTIAVFQFTTWKDKHTHNTGVMVRSSPREIIVTIKDGYACLKEFQAIEK